MLTHERIREILLAHGYAIKPGHDDLKPYVYDAARAIERECASEVAALKHDIERHIANHSADLSATSSTEAAEPRQTIGGIPVIEVEKVTITLEEYETLLRDVRAAPAAGAGQLNLSDATQRPLFKAAFNDRHEFDIFPSDELRSGAFNEFVAGWYAALRSPQLAARSSSPDVSTNPASVTTSEQGGHGVSMSPVASAGQDDALIDAAEERAAFYQDDPRDCIQADVMNAFFAGARWQAARFLY